MNLVFCWFGGLVMGALFSERAIVGSASEQRNLYQNPGNSRRRDFADNGNYRSSYFQEKREAQRK
jgi:hypothetical protein